MAFEDDYIMKIIRDKIRMLVKLLFNIDTENPTVEDIHNQQTRIQAEKLIEKIDDGNINEAENDLYDMMDEGYEEIVLLGAVFYTHLNSKCEDFLEEHDFSHEEVDQGLDTFLEENGVVI